MDVFYHIQICFAANIRLSAFVRLGHLIVSNDRVKYRILLWYVWKQKILGTTPSIGHRIAHGCFILSYPDVFYRQIKSCAFVRLGHLIMSNYRVKHINFIGFLF